MATVRLIIALIVMLLLFRDRVMTYDTWFVGYSIIFGLWVVGGETGRIADILWNSERKIEKFFSEDTDKNSEKTEEKEDGEAVQ